MLKAEGIASVADASVYDAQPWLRQYPNDVPHTLTPSQQTLWELLEEISGKHPDRTAFVFQGEALTFRELREQAKRMSNALAANGIGKGDGVLLLLPNVPHFAVTYYAALRLGAIVVAVAPTSVRREVENFVNDSGAKIVVTIDLLYDKLDRLWELSSVEQIVVGQPIDFMPLWKRLLAKLLRKVPKPKLPVPYGEKVKPMRGFMRHGKGQESERHVEPEDVATLLYTGGTTGIPKAAALTHESLLSNARQMRAWFPQLKEGGETILGALPCFHAYGLTLVLNAGILMAARTILIPNPRALSDIFDAIKQYRPTIFPGVPTLYVALLNDARSRQYDLSSIGVCVCGGAPLPLEVKRDFEALSGGHLYEGYGLTECSPMSHAQPHDEAGRPGSIGLPAPGTKARIVDADSGQPVPVGEAGEMLLQGPQVMKEYWRRPEETADAFQNGWLRTGDIATMDEDGYFYIVDRKKDLIITAGENIFPREIEEVLFEHPKVKEAAVVGIPHEYGGEIAKAFIVLKPGEKSDKKEIIQFASQRLAKHKVPRAVEFRDELPKSTVGKVLRRVLAEEEREKGQDKPRGRRTKEGGSVS